MVRSFFYWESRTEQHRGHKCRLNSLSLSLDQEVIKNVLLELHHKKVKLPGYKHTWLKKKMFGNSLGS